MHFEQRKLNPYADPVSANDLKEGDVYYSVTFVDSDMTIPIMNTFVYSGINLDEGDDNRLYFQDVESYLEGIRYTSANSENYASFFCCDINDTNAIFEFEQALEQLMRCSLRRRGITS